MYRAITSTDDKYINDNSQLTFTCSNLAIETQEERVKYVQS